MTRTVLLTLALAAALGGCKPPLHLGYDFGRAYVETLRVQADLTRPSVQQAGYSLYGIEAALIRVNVETESSDQENGNPEFSGVRGR